MQMRFIAIAIMLCVTPSALATWGAKGSAEPDTKLDRDGGWMFLTPDVSASDHKVYFNAIQGYNVPPNAPTALSPNFATLGTEHEMTPYQAFALLGVWRDCNKDGYIGLGDNGLFEYRAVLLRDPSICPQQAAPTGDTDGLVHNDGTWIHEFIPIGYDCHYAIGCPNTPTQGNLNRFKIEDPNARVWGDFGLPGAIPGNICWITPSPPGSYHTVGQIEDKMDCYGGYPVANNVGSVTGPTSTSSTYASLRATHNPWGEPGDASDATVFDCSSPNTAVGPRVQVTNVYTFQLHSPKVPPTTSTSGSVGGTVNETANGLDDCDRSKNDESRWEGQASNLPYSQEQQQVTAQQAGKKIQSDEQFKFNQGMRGAVGASTALGATSSQDAGTNTYYTFGIWLTNSVCTNCQQYFSRGAFTPTSPTDSLRVQHMSFYAFVSPSAVSAYGLTLPKGSTTGTYGQEACAEATTNVHGGWDCNKLDWYKNIDGSSSNYGEPALGHDTPDNPSDHGGVAMGARVGDQYNLRDVDCYDESVGPARDAGVSWGTLTNTKCD